MNNKNKRVYKTQFKKKKFKFKEFFQEHTKNISYYQSPEEGFRTRIELGLTVLDNQEEFYMTQDSSKIKISELSICDPKINTLMTKLIDLIRKNKILSYRLFQVEFMVNRDTQALITLVYHKRLDTSWIEMASELNKYLHTSIIGRSKNQKIVIEKDCVDETYNYMDRKYSISLFDQCFCQPNPYICEKILSWIFENIDKKDDVLELHCGVGTFTIFLSRTFNRVLSTENSRPSIKALNHNIKMNQCSNVISARLSEIETLDALARKRSFRRLNNINLEDFNFNSIFLNPPRSGIDESTLEKIKEFNQIIYISCGFSSLQKDIAYLSKSHKTIAAGMFDQFPYTEHIESATVLRKL